MFYSYTDNRTNRRKCRRHRSVAAELDFSAAIRHSPSCTPHLSERWVSGLNQRFAKPS